MVDGRFDKYCNQNHTSPQNIGLGENADWLIFFCIWSKIVGAVILTFCQILVRPCFTWSTTALLVVFMLPPLFTSRMLKLHSEALIDHNQTPKKSKRPRRLCQWMLLSRRYSSHCSLRRLTIQALVWFRVALIRWWLVLDDQSPPKWQMARICGLTRWAIKWEGQFWAQRNI